MRFPVPTLIRLNDATAATASQTSSDGSSDWGQAMSDKQLQQDILDVFQWDPRVETAGISVNVENGVVTLTGAVGTDEERVAAAEDIAHVAGVRLLRQKIEVRDTCLKVMARRDGFRFAA